MYNATTLPAKRFGTICKVKNLKAAFVVSMCRHVDFCCRDLLNLVFGELSIRLCGKLWSQALCAEWLGVQWNISMMC